MVPCSLNKEIWRIVELHGIVWDLWSQIVVLISTHPMLIRIFNVRYHQWEEHVTRLSGSDLVPWAETPFH